MDDRPFADKSLKPTEELLRVALGEAFQYYREFDSLTVGYKKAWNFSKSSGWILKVHDGKKALYYFIPLNNSFKISLAIREQEKLTFLGDSDLHHLKEQLEDAKKYSEGFALQFLISDQESFSRCFPLIKKLTEVRK